VFVLTGDDVVVHENRERARRKDHRRRHLTSAPTRGRAATKRDMPRRDIDFPARV